MKAHNGYTGHPGIVSTVSILHDREHRWRGMTTQVTQFIAVCPTCSLARVRLTPYTPGACCCIHSPPPRPTSAPLAFRQHVPYGTVRTHSTYGFHPLDCCGLRIHKIQCHPRVTLRLLARKVLTLVFTVGTNGLCESFHSGNRPEIDAFLLHQFVHVTGIKHTASIPVNPQKQMAFQNVLFRT
jgi:hypothetical protein